jgi:hypothetical protein
LNAALTTHPARGVTTIKNTAPPNLTLDFSWSLPADRIIPPGERFDYHLGFLSDDQARQFPEGSGVCAG